MAGVCADAAAGNVEGVATQPWADAQVAKRRGRTVAKLVAEWSAIASGLEAAAEQFPPHIGRLWVLDLTSVVGSEASAGEPVVPLEVSSFELFRASTGRRSRAQISRMDWSVDAGPFLPAFQFGTFTTSPVDIVE